MATAYVKLRHPDSRQAWIIFLLFYLSGFVALVYEVLWMKELGLLFGNTTQATATVLTAFFCGLGAGGFFWGRIASKMQSPLRAYGYLELAVAASALGYFIILDTYWALYPTLFEYFHHRPGLFLTTKFFLSLAVLFPPALFMGGTLPVISQFLIRRRELLGRGVSGLYAINTLGAACGTLAAGFLLPRYLGFNISFALAILINLIVAVGAILLSRSDKMPKRVALPCLKKTSPDSRTGMGMMYGLAFFSGLVTLSLQVLWVRMFMQVLQNSVYSFSAILTIFLLMLALGAGVANRLMVCRLAPVVSIIILLTVGGVLIILSPLVFSALTDGLSYVESENGWIGYILKILAIALVVMGPALLCLGAILPFTFKLAEKRGESVGRLVGILTAVNTLGAVTGSILAGFVLIKVVGLWGAIRCIAGLYLAAAALLTSTRNLDLPRLAALPAVIAIGLLAVMLLNLSTLPVVKLAKGQYQEKLVEVWEGNAGTVAVTQTSGDLRIKVNNHYTLGGSGARVLEELQTDIPMLLHSDPRRVYVLGLGSGITAGAALKYPLQSLTVTELVADVITAARKHFSPYLHGLFTDPRAKVIAEDGRNYLEGSRAIYDVIIADLFVPWKAGSGYLYTQEHFQAVSERLDGNGLFMQWLPSHQLTEAQFTVIAKTLLSVFPQVTLWRGDFLYGVSVVGLLAQKQGATINQNSAAKKLQSADLELELPLLSYYAGNITAWSKSVKEVTLNRDDLPVIVYDSPITQRLESVHEADFLTGANLIRLMTTLQKQTPRPRDSFLGELADAELKLPDVGLALHRSEILKGRGNAAASKVEYEHFKDLLEEWSQSRKIFISRME